MKKKVLKKCMVKHIITVYKNKLYIMKKITKMKQSNKTTNRKKMKFDDGGLVSWANKYIDDNFRTGANKKASAVNKTVEKKLEPVKKAVNGTGKSSTGSWSSIKDAAASISKAAAAAKAKAVASSKATIQANQPNLLKPQQKLTDGTTKPAGSAATAKSAGAAAAKAAATKSTFNLDAEVKKAMSGAYGSGAARKSALGDNYSKVQAEINKRTAAKKSTTAPKAETKRETPSMSTKSPQEAMKSASTPQSKAKSEQVDSSNDDNMLVNKPGYGAKKKLGGAVKKMFKKKKR